MALVVSFEVATSALNTSFSLGFDAVGVIILGGELGADETLSLEESVAIIAISTLPL